MNLPSLWRRNGKAPVLALTRLQNELDRLFEEISGNASQLSFGASEFCPSCELNEDKMNYVAKFDLPGVKKEDLKIELDGNQLTVSAERREEKKSQDKKNRFSEITYGSYQRTFTLPSTVDDKKVDAKFENGVLTLTMPKTETSKAKQIEVH